MAADKNKKKLCPVCQGALLLQYDKEDPHIRQDPVTYRYRIPMRCSRCGINLEVSVTEKELLEEEDDE